jgi:hypothetical protein
MSEPNEQKSTEIEEVFEPTPLMLKWLDTAIDLGYTASITDVAEASEINRGTWYLWVKDPKFVEWWDSQWQKYLTLNRWKLDAIGMKQAERNFDYWHDMMERTGNLQQKQQLGNMTQVNVSLDKYMK